MLNWIMGRFTFVAFVALINGSPSKTFTPSRGLRLGCPLSPILFLLVVEGLRKSLLKVRRMRTMKGINIGRSIGRTHLLFVDNVLLFNDGSLRNENRLKYILNT
jgi:hypothetical protein